jgi:hypothetical protein
MPGLQGMSSAILSVHARSRGLGGLMIVTVLPKDGHTTGKREYRVREPVFFSGMRGLRLFPYDREITFFSPLK